MELWGPGPGPGGLTHLPRYFGTGELGAIGDLLVMSPGAPAAVPDTATNSEFVSGTPTGSDPKVVNSSSSADGSSSSADDRSSSDGTDTELGSGAEVELRDDEVHLALMAHGDRMDPPGSPPSSPPSSPCTTDGDNPSSSDSDNSDHESSGWSSHSSLLGKRKKRGKGPGPEHAEPESDIEEFGLTQGKMMVAAPPDMRYSNLMETLKPILQVEQCTSHSTIHTWNQNWAVAIQGLYNLVASNRTRLFDMATRTHIYNAMVGAMKVEALQQRLTRELREIIQHTGLLSLSDVLKYLRKFCVAEGGEHTVLLERYLAKLVTNSLPKASEVPVRVNCRAELFQMLRLNEWQYDEIIRVYCGTRDKGEDWRWFLEMFAPFAEDKPVLSKETVGLCILKLGT